VSFVIPLENRLVFEPEVGIERVLNSHRLRGESDANFDRIRKGGLDLRRIDTFPYRWFPQK
jgi:hypothetical protein